MESICCVAPLQAAARSCVGAACQHTLWDIAQSQPIQWQNMCRPLLDLMCLCLQGQCHGTCVHSHLQHACNPSSRSVRRFVSCLAFLLTRHTVLPRLTSCFGTSARCECRMHAARPLCSKHQVMHQFISCARAPPAAAAAVSVTMALGACKMIARVPMGCAGVCLMYTFARLASRSAHADQSCFLEE